MKQIIREICNQHEIDINAAKCLVKKKRKVVYVISSGKIISSECFRQETQEQNSDCEVLLIPDGLKVVFLAFSAIWQGEVRYQYSSSSSPVQEETGAYMGTASSSDNAAANSEQPHTANAPSSTLPYQQVTSAQSSANDAAAAAEMHTSFLPYYRVTPLDERGHELVRFQSQFSTTPTGAFRDAYAQKFGPPSHKRRPNGRLFFGLHYLNMQKKLRNTFAPHINQVHSIRDGNGNEDTITIRKLFIAWSASLDKAEDSLLDRHVTDTRNPQTLESTTPPIEDESDEGVEDYRSGRIYPRLRTNTMKRPIHESDLGDSLLIPLFDDPDQLLHHNPHHAWKTSSHVKVEKPHRSHHGQPLANPYNDRSPNKKRISYPYNPMSLYVNSHQPHQQQQHGGYNQLAPAAVHANRVHHHHQQQHMQFDETAATTTSHQPRQQHMQQYHRYHLPNTGYGVPPPTSGGRRDDTSLTSSSVGAVAVSTGQQHQTASMSPFTNCYSPFGSAGTPATTAASVPSVQVTSEMCDSHQQQQVSPKQAGCTNQPSLKNEAAAQNASGIQKHEVTAIPHTMEDFHFSRAS